MKDVTRVLIIILLIGIIAAIWFVFGDRMTYGLRVGVLAGVVIGAIVGPISRSPDLTGRAIVGGVGAAFIMALLEIWRAAPLFKESSLLTPGGAAVMGTLALPAFIRILQAVFAGAIVAIALAAPGKVIIGGVIGALVGAIVGGISGVTLVSQGIHLSQEIFLVLVGFITLTIFSVIGTRQ